MEMFIAIATVATVTFMFFGALRIGRVIFNLNG